MIIVVCIIFLVFYAVLYLFSATTIYFAIEWDLDKLACEFYVLGEVIKILFGIHWFTSKAIIFMEILLC